MKRTLLPLFVLILITSLANAQVCIPNPDYADEAFGIWPTPEDGFAEGVVGELYNQVIDFKVPTDPAEVPDAGGIAPPGSTVDSIVVSGLNGLPDGISWQCESHTPSPCTFLPEVPGCAVLSGVPEESGTYPIEIQTTIYLFVPGIGNFPLPFNYADYSITINSDVTTIDELAQYGLGLKQNAPNPFDDNTMIEFTLNQAVQVDFNVYNLLGKVVHTEQVNAVSGQNRIELNAGELNMSPGIYLYSLGINGQSVTRKMVVK